MRILIPTAFSAVGGSTVILMEAAKALRANHDVHVRAPLDGCDSRMPEAITPHSAKTYLEKLSLAWVLVRMLPREFLFCLRYRPNAIYVHDTPDFYLYAPIALLTRTRIVRHMHHRESGGFLHYLRSKLTSAAIFLSIKHRAAPIWRAGLWRLQAAMPWCVIRNPVTIPERREPEPCGTLRIGMVGSICDRKNQAFAIPLLAEIQRLGKSVRLLIFGEVIEPSYEQALQSLIAEHGLGDSVAFSGFVPAAYAFSQIDILLHCAKDETMGLVVAEAIGAGLPAVVSDIDAHRDIASTLGTPALALVPLDRPLAFVEAICKTKGDPAAREKVERHYGRQEFATEICAFFGKMEKRWGL